MQPPTACSLTESPTFRARNSARYIPQRPSNGENSLPLFPFMEVESDRPLSPSRIDGRRIASRSAIACDGLTVLRRTGNWLLFRICRRMRGPVGRSSSTKIFLRGTDDPGCEPPKGVRRSILPVEAVSVRFGGNFPRETATNGCRMLHLLCSTARSGDVAQLVRALPCHGRGRGFEPRRPRHSFQGT